MIYELKDPALYINQPIELGICICEWATDIPTWVPAFINTLPDTLYGILYNVYCE